MYIKAQQPRVVLFEESDALAEKKFEWLLKAVVELLGTWGYKVWWSKVNTKDHGLPQNRSRMYLIGILDSCVVEDFSFPKPVAPLPLASILTPDNKLQSFTLAPNSKCGLANIEWGMAALKSRGIDPAVAYAFIDVHASPSRRNTMVDVAPCLTRTRAMQHGFYLTRRGAMLDCKEIMALQGFPASRMDDVIDSLANNTDKNSVKVKDLLGAVGNSMSINVLMRLLPGALKSAGLRKSTRRTEFDKLPPVRG